MRFRVFRGGEHLMTGELNVGHALSMSGRLTVIAVQNELRDGDVVYADDTFWKLKKPLTLAEFEPVPPGGLYGKAVRVEQDLAQVDRLKRLHGGGVVIWASDPSFDDDDDLYGPGDIGD